MIATFKENSPAAIIWLFILSIAVHSHFFIEAPIVSSAEEDGLISFFLNRYFAHLHSAIIIIIYHILVIVQALRLNFLFSDQRMFNKPNYLTAMVYVMLTGLFAEWSNITPALVINIFVIWLYAMTNRLYNTPNPKTLLFNIGLVIGICVILYHPSALLVLVAMFALLIVRPFNITEWIVMLMGILAPYYFLLSFLYLTDRLQRLQGFIPDWQLNLPDVHSVLLFAISISIIVIMLMIGLFYWQAGSRRMLIQVRKNWSVLMVMLIVMVPVPFISKNAGLDSLFIWIIPVSSFIANAFLAPKKPFLPIIMFWFLFVLGIVNTWQLLKNYHNL